MSLDAGMKVLEFFEVNRRRKMAKVKSKSKSIFPTRGGYTGSPVKTLPKVTTPAPTAKANSTRKSSSKGKT